MSDNLENITLRNCRTISKKDFVPLIGLWKYYTHWCDITESNYERFKPENFNELLKVERKTWSNLSNLLIISVYNSLVIGTSIGLTTGLIYIISD